MTIPEFIKAAIEGGWTFKECPKDVTEFVFSFDDGAPKNGFLFSEGYIFLDPKAWEAVVKSKNIIMAGEHGIILPHEIPEELMHRMIASLCNGRTLEEFVQTL